MHLPSRPYWWLVNSPSFTSLRAFVIILILESKLSINDKISASIDGKRVEIGFNNSYLTDCLKTVDVDEVNIELNGPISPIIIISSMNNLHFHNLFC